MAWIDEINQRLEQRRQGTPERQNTGSSEPVNRESGQYAKKKSPLIAAILGFLFNGVGLGIYLRSWLDFLVPVAISILIAILSGGILVVVSPFFCAFYGFIRAKSSNAELTQPQKKTWACTGCSTIALLATLALCWHKNGSAESFIPSAFSTVLLLAGWKADSLGNQEKAAGCGLLLLWIFLLAATIMAFIGVAATS